MSLDSVGSSNSKEAHGGKYRKLNDYDIRKLSLQSESGDSVDLRMMFTQFHFYEDIFANNVSGQVIIKDALNLISNLPINGREKITFSFITPGHPDKEAVEKTCSIYKVDDIIMAGSQRAKIYKLFFTSDEKILNEYIKVSKSYTGKISTMVDEIVGEFLPSAELLTSGTTSEKHRFIMPNWTPLRCINWLCERAESGTKETQSNYVFYEDRKGYHFIDLGYLFDKEPVAKYTYNPTAGHQVYGAEGPQFATLATNFFNASTFRVQTATDTLKWLDQGLYASTLHTHDITKKKFEVETYNYKDEFTNTYHVYGNQLTSERDELHNRPNAKVSFQPKQDKQYTEGVDPDNQKYENWFLHRKSQMVQMEGQKITIEVPGNHSVRCGDLIEFEYADTVAMEKDTSDYVEKTFSGVYLVSAVHHFMEAEHYRCGLELIRDSRYEPLPNQSSLSNRSQSTAFA